MTDTQLQLDPVHVSALRQALTDQVRAQEYPRLATLTRAHARRNGGGKYLQGGAAIISHAFPEVPYRGTDVLHPAVTVVDSSPSTQDDDDDDGECDDPDCEDSDCITHHNHLSCVAVADCDTCDNTYECCGYCYNCGRCHGAGDEYQRTIHGGPYCTECDHECDE